MSESDVVNTNNNSTDEIATKDPKNESLKRKENEVCASVCEEFDFRGIE